jgi:staphyloferrin B biosynthesis citrate synthase
LNSGRYSAIGDEICDVQHSLFSLETIGHIAQAALGCGIAPLARVRSCGDPDTSLLLDNGVTGVVFPDVNNAADARRGVDAAKFAPIGKRSVSGGYPVFDYRAVPVGDSMRMLNDATLVVCMIETREGLANIEEIAAVDGVDVIHVGSNDLLTALSKPGRFDDPEIFSAIDRAIAAARSHGKFAGLGGMRNVERQVELIRKGVRFVTTQTDIGFLLAAAALDRRPARRPGAARALERGPEAEDDTDQRNHRTAQDFAIALDGAEPQPLQTRARIDAQRHIGRDRAEREDSGHHRNQCHAVSRRGEKRRDAFDHRR